jgi:hypothetical protein
VNLAVLLQIHNQRLDINDWVNHLQWSGNPLASTANRIFEASTLAMTDCYYSSRQIHSDPWGGQ